MKYSKIGTKVLSAVLAAALIFGNLTAVRAEEMADPVQTVESTAAEPEGITAAAEDQQAAAENTGSEEPDAAAAETADAEDEDAAPADKPEAASAETDEPAAAENTQTDEPEKDPAAQAEDAAAAENETDPVKAADEEEPQAAEKTEEPSETPEAAKEETVKEDTAVESEEETKEDTIKAADAGIKGTILTETNPVNGRYTVKVSGFSSSVEIKNLKVGIWSKEGGKDDLSWHEMSATPSGTAYTFYSYIKNFAKFDEICAQVVVVKADGKEEVLGETSFLITAPAVKSAVPKTNVKTGAFAVTVNGLSSEFAVTKVRALVSRKADPSDKKWYTLEKSSETKYVLTGANIKDLGSYSGTYNVQVYAYTKNGPTVLVKETSFDFAVSNGAFSYKDKNEGTKGEEQKAYTIKTRGLAQPNGVSKVEFKVIPLGKTSENRWYTASYKNGYYTADILISDFKIGGQYKVQTYVTDKKGTKKAVRSKEAMNVDGVVGGKVVVSESNPSGKFTIALKNSTAPSGLETVKFTIWTLSDKSDKRTFIGKKQSDGSYTAAVNISKLNYNTGTYHVLVKTVMGNGIPKNRKQADVTYNTSENFPYVIKTDFGKRTLGVVNASAGNIRFAVWSKEGGQDDLHWVNGVKSGNKWTSNIDLTDYMHAGTFNVHVYSGDTYLASKTFKAEEGEAGKTGWFYENGLKFYYKAGQKVTDLSGMVGGPFQICVNRQCNTITVYALDGGNGYIIPVIAFVCSTGLPGMETPTGVYYTYAKNRWEELMGPSWGQYSARVVDGIYIHSMPSNIPNSCHGIPWSEYNKLGSPASHGCIRVNVAAAKWIYDHCGVGTEVKIYDSSYPGPFGKPTAPKMTPDMDWDPTDPLMQ